MSHLHPKHDKLSVAVCLSIVLAKSYYWSGVRFRSNGRGVYAPHPLSGHLCRNWRLIHFNNNEIKRLSFSFSFSFFIYLYLLIVYQSRTLLFAGGASGGFNRRHGDAVIRAQNSPKILPAIQSDLTMIFLGDCAIGDYSLSFWHQDAVSSAW